MVGLSYKELHLSLAKGALEYSAGFSAISDWYELGKTYVAKSGLKCFSYGVSATLAYSQDIDERKDVVYQSYRQIRKSSAI